MDSSLRRHQGTMAAHCPWWTAWLLVVGCATAPRFPLREPIWRDEDERPFAPAPAEYESPFAWDAANQTVFRPLARVFAVDPAGQAQ